MKKKSIGLCALALTALLGLSACGGKSGPSEPGDQSLPNATKIVIYAGGSSDFSWVKGSEEAEVIDTIERAYYDATGNALDFQVSFWGSDMHTKLENELKGGTQIDIVISHTRGGQGIDDLRKGPTAHYNLYNALDYAPNLYKQIEGAPLDCLTTANNDVIAIPSVISPYKFGILVRKDYMEKCGFTDDAEKAKTEFKPGQNYRLVDDLVTFEAMCKEMNKLTGNSYAVTGAPWDLEKVVTMGAYGDAGYFSSTLVEENGKKIIKSGFATPQYKDILALEYKWAREGVTSPAEGEWLIAQGEQTFVSGKTGVFVIDPTIQHLIKVARMTKSVNPEAEFTVLGPLTANDESEKKGFMRNPEATFGAAIMKESENVNEIMAFLNWVYKNPENYNLCRYGVEGKHWVNNGDGTFSYPEGSKYSLSKPAYSGILTLVENQRISNLTYSVYTAEERRWIKDIAGNADNYVQNDVMDYMFTSTDEYNELMADKMMSVYHGLALASWQGKSDGNPLAPSSQDPSRTHFDFIIDGYNLAVRHIQEDFTTQYNKMKANRVPEESI